MWLNSFIMAYIHLINCLKSCKNIFYLLYFWGIYSIYITFPVYVVFFFFNAMKNIKELVYLLFRYIWATTLKINKNSKFSNLWRHYGFLSVKWLQNWSHTDSYVIYWIFQLRELKERFTYVYVAISYVYRFYYGETHVSSWNSPISNRFLTILT